MSVQDRWIERLKSVPQRPGIYLMRDETGQVIYVGKANRLRSRLRSHFSGRDNSPKARLMLSQIVEFDYIVLRSEKEALILECRYIKEFKPKFNVDLRDDKTYPLVKVTIQEPYARLIVTRQKKPDGALYLGPFTDAAALRQTVETLTRIFRLRSCRPSHPGQKDYDHCLYQMMKWCAAPCVGKVSEKEYRRHVDDAVNILAGRSREMIEKLKYEMEEASRAMRYEQAAEMRDRINALEQVVGSKTGYLHQFRRVSAWALEESRALAEVLGLSKVPDRIEAFDISNFAGAQAVGSMVSFIKGQPDKRFYRRFRIKTVNQIDDYAMMKEVLMRRYRRLIAERQELPDLILIDGGKGQLSAALEVLSLLSLSIPVIGLAKRYEEIITAHGKDPIRLAKDSPALYLVQRLRDEAHRFAVSYHQHLRDLKIKESILDDIRGLSQIKKNELLKFFGSLEKIRRSSADEIMKVRRISKPLAEKILNTLKPK